MQASLHSHAVLMRRICRSLLTQAWGSFTDRYMHTILVRCDAGMITYMRVGN